jgi:hypothetical protein
MISGFLSCNSSRYNRLAHDSRLPFGIRNANTTLEQLRENFWRWRQPTRSGAADSGSGFGGDSRGGKERTDTWDDGQRS